MSNPYANYYEDHESRESLCAAEHVADCSLCHEANAERTIEFEGKDIAVCGYCYTAIKGFEQGDVAQKITGVPANDKDAKRADDPSGDRHSRPLGEAPCEDNKQGSVA